MTKLAIKFLPIICLACILAICGIWYEALANQTSLMPPDQQFFDNNGKPLAGGKVYTCAPGTSCGPGSSTLKPTYQGNSDATAINPNPVILDSTGRGNIWLNGFYKISVYDAIGNLIRTRDNVPGLGSILNMVTDSNAIHIGQSIAFAPISTALRGKTGIGGFNPYSSAVAPAHTYTGSTYQVANIPYFQGPVDPATWGQPEPFAWVCTGPSCPTSPWIDDSSYISLTAAAADAATKGVALHISKVWTITANTDLSAAPEVDVLTGGGFTSSNGSTVTLPANFHSGLSQCFFGNVAAAALRYSVPEWFGTGTAAMQTSINALSSGGKWVADGTYTSGKLNLVSNVEYTGHGTITQASADNESLLYGSGLSNVKINNLTLDGGTGQTNGGDKGLIYLVGCSNCGINNTVITNASANAIELPGAENTRVTGNYIYNSYSNGIITGSTGAHDVVISNNVIDTTTTQDGIFATASFGSTSTSDKIYRITITGNTVKNSGDTGIELGQNSNDSSVTGNNVTNSTNPNIIIRDVYNCAVTGNTVDGNSSYNQVGIGVIPLALSAYDYQLTVAGNEIKAAGFGIDVQTSGVSVYSNKIVGGGASGSRGIRGWTTNNKITGNSIDTFEYGVLIGETVSTPGASLSGIDVEQNSIQNVTGGISAYNKTMTDVIIQNNNIRNHSGVALKFDSCTMWANFRDINNTVSTLSSRASGVIGLPNAGSQFLAIPSTQYSGNVLLPPGFGSGYYTIQFQDGSNEFVNFYTWPHSGTGDGAGYTFLKSSPNIHDTNTGTGWAITTDGSGNLILTRNGVSITSPGGYVFSPFN